MFHMVFIPRCWRKTLYGDLPNYLGEVFHRLALQRESRILDGNLMPDHVRLRPCRATGSRLDDAHSKSLALASMQRSFNLKNAYRIKTLRRQALVNSDVGFRAPQANTVNLCRSFRRSNCSISVATKNGPASQLTHKPA